MEIPKIDLREYEYTLPDERIAKFPHEKRDASKLLHFLKGNIKHLHFYDLPELLSSDTLLVYNDTKVIPARLIFQRETGARIEIFLLQPIAPTTVIPEIMLASYPVTWETMIGNVKKWKDGEILKGQVQVNDRKVVLSAKLINRETKAVEFSWDDPEIAFVDLVEASGEVPLPPTSTENPMKPTNPAIRRSIQKEGAVAAPTAGLHFTEEVFQKLRAKGIREAQVTLHVSAGTFQPIKAENVLEHPMHSEQIQVSRETIEQLLAQKEIP